MTTGGKSEHETNISQYPVTFVEIIFTVVIGASILYFNDLLFPPDFVSPKFWALIVAYLTAITSWFSWHNSTSKYPYTNSGIGRIRSALDAAIVAMYVALLFFGSRLNEFMGWYLWSFVIVFLLYFVVGALRRAEYRDPQASKISLIIYHGLAMFILALSYVVLSNTLPQWRTGLTWAFVFIPAAPVVSLRWLREWRRLPWVEKAKKKITIAVDMDGVLVEQIVPILQKLKQETGIVLCKCDITDWEYPIDCTSIKAEIEKAEREEQFVRKMPPMKDAVEALQILSKEFEIVIATSRETCTDCWSRDWLKRHKITYKRFINTRSGGKALSNVDLLIDDYIGNMQEFIINGSPSRQAILFAQPWNQDIRTISDLIVSGRIKIAHSWQTVLALLGCQLQQTGKSKN